MRVALVAALTVVFAIAAWVRLRGSQERGIDWVADVDSAARAQLAKVKTTPFASTNPKHLIDSIRSTPISDGLLHCQDAGREVFGDVRAEPPRPGVAANVKAEVVPLAVEFILARFAQPDPVAYRRIREACGDSFRPKVDLQDLLGSTYDRFCGPDSANASQAEWFDAIWNAQNAGREPGVMNVVALSTEADSIAVAIGYVPPRSTQLVFPLLSSTAIGAEGWYGTQSANSMCFYRRPVLDSMTQAPEHRPGADAACIGVIVELRDGTLIPVRLLFLRPLGSKWTLEAVTFANKHAPSLPPVTF
jgi:hypothetical protein